MVIYMRIKINLLKRAITLLIIASPILNIYKIGSLPLGFGDLALCLAVLIYFLIKDSTKLSVKKNGCKFFPIYILFFLVSILTILPQGNFNISDFTNKWSRIIVFVIILDIVLLDGVDFDYAKIKCIDLSVLLSITVILQEILKRMGIVVLPYLSIFPLNYSVPYSELINVLNRRNSLGIWRVSSIFPEPAHFAQYTLMGLAILLFNENSKLKENWNWNLIKSIIITIAIIISASANGYFIGVSLWLIWFLYTFREKITTRKLFIGVVFIVVGVLIFFKTDAFDKALYRLGTVNSLTEGSTGGVRLLQGLYVFKQLSPSEKFMGVGFGNIAYYLMENSITTPFLSEVGNEYMNAFSTVLVSGGIIGFTLFLHIWLKMWIKSKTMLPIVAMFILTILYCSSSIFYSCTSILFFTFVLCKERNERLELGVDKL